MRGTRMMRTCAGCGRKYLPWTQGNPQITCDDGRGIMDCKTVYGHLACLLDIAARQIEGGADYA